MTTRDRESKVGEAFKRDIAEHEMTVLHEEGLYRHVRFKKPSTSMYWFDLITWPNNLTVNGDMGCWTFSRVEDMFGFFAGTRINPGYWDEKVRGGTPCEEYSEQLFRDAVSDHIAEYAERYPGLKEAADEDIFRYEDLSYEDNARAVLDSFKHEDFRFTDVWEWRFKEHSYQFLWCCYAIQWGVSQFRAAREARAAS